MRSLLLAAWSLCALAGGSFAQQRPNIVVLYADDLGYGDVGCYGGKIATPHIDALAASGMRFTDAHSSSGVCTPSRYTLLTGRYHWRTRLQRGIVGKWGAPLIAEDRTTVASMLRDAGYRTVAVGKWHLGWNWPMSAADRKLANGPKQGAVASDEQRVSWQRVFSKAIKGGPTTRGFDSYFGTDVPNWPPFCFIENDRTVGIPSEFLPGRLFRNNQASVQGPALAGWTLEPILPALAKRAEQVIAAAAPADEPYFLYVPLTSPHTPLAVNEEWHGKSGLGAYADFVMETDHVIGRVLRAIDASGEADRTLVLMTSDNGCAPYIGVTELEKQGHAPSGPLRGYKSDVWEGGHRVPFVARWPGVVEPGTVSASLVHQADLMATCAALVEHELAPDEGEDSVSFLPLLRGSKDPVRTTSISQSMRGLLSIRRGAWKLIPGQGSGGWAKGQDEQPGQLYNLAEDLGETNNLFGDEPEHVASLSALLETQIQRGRSTPGESQKNDGPVEWDRMKR